MAVDRYILLIALVLAPLPLFGQDFSMPRPAFIDGPRYGVPPDASVQNNGRDPRSGPMASSQFDAAALSQLIPVQPGAVPSAARSRVTRHYASPIWKASEKGGYFGIMGAIAKPGVYFHQNERLTLSDLLKKAGGTTALASGGVRIVRQGRGGLQTFLSAESPYEVMNGDVLIIESNRFASRLDQSSNLQTINTSGAQGTGGDAEKTTGPAPAYLGFVNLTSRPVIVPVPNDQATLPMVMRWLRQDSQSPPLVRVLTPNPLLRQGSSLPVEQQLLASGTVLVFDPATVQRDRLPEFPAVIGLPNAAPKPAAPVAASPTVQQPTPVTPQAPTIRTDLRAPQVVPPAPPTGPSIAPSPPRGASRDSARPLGQHPAGAQHARQGLDQPHSPDAIRVPGGPPSQSSGPLLLMPQSSGPNAPPRRLDAEADQATARLQHEVQPMGWQSRPPARHENGVPKDLNGVEGFEEDVIPANGELGGLDDGFAGPALDLPQPVPKLLRPEVPTEPQPKPVVVPHPVPASLFSNLSLQVVWFSLGSMLLLAGGLWCLTWWDGRRPVRTLVAAGHGGRTAPGPSTPAANSHIAFSSLRFLKRASNAGVATQSMAPPTDAPRTESEAAKSTVPASGANPSRTISRQEQILRDHFRQARRPHIAVADAGSVGHVADAASIREDFGSAPDFASSNAVPEVLAKVPHVVSHHSTTDSALHSQDILDRVLRARHQR